MFATEMHGVIRIATRHGGGMSLTENGLYFNKEGDHWRCVERPALLMLRGGGYWAADLTVGSLDEALRHLEARGST